MFPYDASSKPIQSVTTNTSTPEDKYPCQEKKVWHAGGSGRESPTSYVPGSGGYGASGTTCTKKTMYDQLLVDYNDLCIIAETLGKNVISAIEQNAELRKELGRFYIKQGEAFIQDAKRIREESLGDIKKLIGSINHNWCDHVMNPAELTKPDPDQMSMDGFQNVIGSDMVNLDPARIDNSDYPKANYEVTTKN